MPFDSLDFTVYGTAAPAGSKRGIPIKRAGGKIGVNMIHDSKRTRPWMNRVGAAAAEAMEGRPLMRGPLEASFVFYRKRPKYHYGTGRNRDKVKDRYKSGADSYPISKPDLTKLVRAAEDAMKGIVFDDDSQIVTQHNDKRFGEPERCEITIREKM